MKRILKSVVLGIAVAAITLPTVAPASADHWRRHHHRHHDKGGDALAAGLVGLAFGAIAAGILTQPRRPEAVYIDPPARRPLPPRHYRNDHYPPAPAYRGRVTYSYAPEPWTREWYRACSLRYRTFEAQSGTFMGFDGKRHFCVIR